MNLNNALRYEEDNITVPETSCSVKVTNIKNPYFIRIYKTKHYIKRSNLISTKLTNFMNNVKLDAKNNGDPNLEDFVIVHSNISHDVDLPAWLCRGIVTHFDPMTMRYNILLVDYGISVALLRDDFIITSPDIIPDKYLSSTIGIYNIIPTITKKHESTNEFVQFVTDKWTIKAIQLTKELIIASSAIYFERKACDKHRKYYGELYLDIDDQIIRLSSTLIKNGCATYLEGDLLKLIEEPDYNKYKKEIDNGTTIYYIQNSYNHNSNKQKNLTIDLVKCHGDQSGAKCIESFYKNGCSSTINKKKIWEVLVYGNATCKNLNFVCDAQFPAKIHKAWDLLVKSNKPKRIQSFIWPAIKERLNVVAVGPQGSGKTYGYVFAISGLLAVQKSLPCGNKPLALILCASSSEVFGIHSLCMEFLQGYDNINPVAALRGKTYRSLAAEIYSGCQILISTPRFLAQFMTMHKNLINLDYLSHLILDNADVILDKYYSSIGELFGKHKIINNREVKNNELSSLQIILLARHFTRPMKAVVWKVMDNPYICITSFIEAAIFKSVCPKMYLVNSKFRNEKILNLLRSECKLKTMIVCTTFDEAKGLYMFLSKYKKTLLVHEREHLLKIEAIKEVWKTSVSGFHSILISTDEALPDLHITDVDWLIHYSVSLDKKTKFNFRFSTLMNNLQMEKSNCKVTIFVNENDNKQFLSIINMMQRMGVILSDDMLLNIERISMSLDKSKKEYPICDKVKSLGFCPYKNSCVFRHCILPEVDAPMTGIEVGDKVKLIVTYVHDASHFSVRVIEYVKASNSDVIAFPNDEYMKITSKIQSFYGNINNRKRATIIEIGNLYGLEDAISSFQRVQILQIKHRIGTNLETVKCADVRCIDTGNILEDVKVEQLFWLPEELSKLSVHIVEVFLVGITPCDDEYEWNNLANEAVHNWLDKNSNESSYIVGVVFLHLGNTIWTNTLKIGTKMAGQYDITGCCLKTELIDKHHAVANEEQVRMITAFREKSEVFTNNG